MPWTRRKFILTGVSSLFGYALLDAFWLEKLFIEINEFFLGNATKDDKDITVVQVSDLHLQSINYQHKLLAERLNLLNPDLILFTGDTIDDNKKISVLDRFLKLINKDIKKVAITGNWEYWGEVNLEDLGYTYTDHNCDLLINQSRQYTFRDKTISVTGVDDYIGGNADIKKALESYQKSHYHIILNHCPKYSEQISQNISKEIKADCILSGHTHGGQINLFGFVLFLPQGSGKYLKGWYDLGETKMYVSKGIGTSILPARFMAQSEVAIFNLSSD